MLNGLEFKRIFKKITGLALPMALSFTFSFEVFLSILLLNCLAISESEIASATLVSVLMNTVCVLAISPLFAVAIILSGKLGELHRLQALGEKANLLAEKIAVIRATHANALLIGLIVTLPAFLALYLSKSLLISFFHQNLQVANAAETFLKPYAFAVPALMARMCFEQIMFGFGKTKAAMWIGLVSLLLGLGLSLLLGFGSTLLKIPKMGSLGIALGFIFEAYLTALCYGLYVGFAKPCKDFFFFHKIIKSIIEHMAELKALLKVGLAISFTVFLELGMVLAIGIFSGLIGVKEQSAMTFNMQFIYFEFIALAAFSFSCAQEISRSLGAHKTMEAIQIAKYGLLTTLIYLSPLPILFAIYPNALAFISGGAPNEVGILLQTLVPIMSLGVILDSLRYNLLQQSRAFNDLLIPNLLAVLGLSFGLFFAYILGQGSYKINGVAAGYAIGMGITAFLLLGRWLMKLKSLSLKKIN